MSTKRKMSKVTRGVVSEACLARILDGWTPGWMQHEWVRLSPHAPMLRWKAEPMTEDEIRLLGEYR